MDWFEAAQKKAAKLSSEVQKHAEQIQLNAASLLTRGNREHVFHDGPLGFTVEGAFVDSVTPGGQADQLGIKAGDRLLAVDGYQVPEKRLEVIRQWLDDMPRPGTLTFAPDASQSVPSIDKTRVLEAAETPSTTSVAKVVTSADTQCVAPSPAAEGAQLDTSLHLDSATIEASEHESACTLDELARSRVEVARLRAALHAEAECSAGLRGEINFLRQQCHSLESDFEDAQKRLRRFDIEREDEGVGTSQPQHAVQVRFLQEDLGSLRAERDAIQVELVGVRAELAAATARSKELVEALARSRDKDCEDAEEREQMLSDEMARLRGLLTVAEVNAHTSLRNVESNLADSREECVRLAKEVRDLKSRLNSAGTATERVAEELHQEYRREVECLKDKHDANLRSLQMRATAAEAALQEARRKPNLASVAPETVKDGESTSGDERDFVRGSQPAVVADIAQPFDVGPSEVQNLKDQVEFLERQRANLQRKLNARPIVYQAPKAPDGGALESGFGVSPSSALPFEPELRRVLGPIASAALIRLHRLMDQQLKRFTRALLQNGAWLWLFYTHILVLYVVSSSWYAQESQLATTSTDLDVLGANIHELASVLTTVAPDADSR